MRGSAILTERISGDRLAEVRRLLLDVYAEVYRDALDDGFHSVERFDERLGGYAARPGWEAVVGYDEGQPLGYAFGAPLPAQARWWVDVHPPLDADYVTETGDRTFALFELMVRKPWRGTGAARRLHDELVDGRQESRITLLVDSEHPKVRRRYEEWGYRSVGQTRPFPDSPLYQAMVLDRQYTASANSGGRPRWS